MSRYIQIIVSEDNFERLQKLKISKGESMDTLINRLLLKYEKVVQ
jgi:predicted CopG family antitoxin